MRALLGRVCSSHKRSLPPFISVYNSSQTILEKNHRPLYFGFRDPVIYKQLRFHLPTSPLSKHLFTSTLPQLPPHIPEEENMATHWDNVWDDIVGGGPGRWKAVDPDGIKIALQHISEHAQRSNEGESHLRILCPLAGDDPFVHLAWEAGHTLYAVELTATAVKRMRLQFGGEDEWSREELDTKLVQWTHSSRRVTIFEGDLFSLVAELKGSIDAVYDKDSFGALEKEDRPKYVDTVSYYLKHGGIVYTEVKYKEAEEERQKGPPFHLKKDDLIQPDNFGKGFEYKKDLGELYKISMLNSKQTGHILVKK